jgi:hypothetical protein
MIIRARHDRSDPYFRFRRATAQDSQLSWAARGLLAYLFSKPDNWEVSPAALMKEGDLKRDALYRVIAELKIHGYVDRYQERRADGALGRWITDVYEIPNLDKDSTPLPDLPCPVQPLPVEPDTVNPEAVKTDTTYKREVHNREITYKQQQHIEASGNRGDKTAAAAAERVDKESHAGRFPLDQIEAFIRTTKPHKTESQIGGLARHLLRTGEEDEQIAEWQARRAQTSALTEHSPECRLCQGTGWQVISGKGARPCPNLSIGQNSPST